MYSALFLGLIAAFSGFRCSTDSGTVEGGRSSLEDCSESSYCEKEEELCWGDEFCEEDEDNCSDYGDEACHKDCTDDEECGGSEDCTYVGSDTWLCI